MSHLDKRQEINISLKTKDETEAIIRAKIYEVQIENYWKALIQSGVATHSDEKYKAAVEIAKSLGFAYKTTEQVAASTLNEIVERLSFDVSNKEQTEALLGGIKEPEILLSECLELFWPLITDRLAEKTKHQITKWKNPRTLAINNFIDVVGDCAINNLKRSDVLDFREWWLSRISDGYNGDSGNKQIRHVKQVLTAIALHNEMEIDFEVMFVKTRFEYTITPRSPFEADFVQEKLLMGLDGLNDVYKMAVYAMSDTGAREVELLRLAPSDIFLNSEIPYIYIRPRESYKLKTKTSERKIPLVGAALHAFSKYPKGFGYKGNPDSFSSAVNKYLRENDLKPTDNHSLYSLRHTFKDRLRDTEVAQEIIDELMGHRKGGPEYGRGYKLEAKHEILTRMAFSIACN